jgi:hypothetical protein
LRTARQAMQPSLPLRRKRSGAAGRTAVPPTHSPEGGPSEGTGQVCIVRPEGWVSSPSWQPAKRGSAFSEADDRSRVARRSKATVRSGPDPKGACRRAGAGRLPQGACRETGCWQANGPLRSGSSRGRRHVAALFGARASDAGIPSAEQSGFKPSAAGGRSGRRKSVTRMRVVQGGRGSARSGGRLSVGCGRFAAHPSSRPGSRIASNAALRRRFVLRWAGRTSSGNGASGC